MTVLFGDRGLSFFTESQSGTPVPQGRPEGQPTASFLSPAPSLCTADQLLVDLPPRTKQWTCNDKVIPKQPAASFLRCVACVGGCALLLYIFKHNTRSISCWGQVGHVLGTA